MVDRWPRNALIACLLIATGLGAAGCGSGSDQVGRSADPDADDATPATAVLHVEGMT